MKNMTMLGFAVVLLLAVGFFVFAGANEPGVNENVIAGATLEGNVQKITLGLKDFNYYPSTIKVKAGQPVSISGNEQLIKKGGCLKSLVVRELKESAYLKTTSDSLDFTPEKKGTYTITCSMGMGYARLIVE